jgi:hypothetical protein
MPYAFLSVFPQRSARLLILTPDVAIDLATETITSSTTQDHMTCIQEFRLMNGAFGYRPSFYFRSIDNDIT